MRPAAGIGCVGGEKRIIDEIDDIDQFGSISSICWRNVMARTRIGKIRRKHITPRTKATRVRELEGVLHEAAGGLSPTHVAALAAHPDAVCTALAVAASALTMDDSGRPAVETIGSAAPHRTRCRGGRRADVGAHASRRAGEAAHFRGDGGADGAQDPAIGP